MFFGTNIFAFAVDLDATAGLAIIRESAAAFCFVDADKLVTRVGGFSGSETTGVPASTIFW